MPHLLIIGANGVLGSAAAKHFLQKGFTVSAFIRNKNNAINLEKEGARIIIGDLTNPGSLKNIFDGVDAVLTAAHGMISRGKNRSKNVDGVAHKQLIDGSKKAGVKHFIYASVHGVSPDNPIDFFRTKYEMEQYLTGSGVNFSILRMPAFMEWHAYNLIGKSIVEKGKVTIFGSGEDTLNFIAVKDIVGTLDVIVLNEQYYNRIIPLLGPQNFSRNQVAALFDRHLKRKSKVGHVPAGMLKVLAVLFKPFHEGLSRIMKFSAMKGNAPEVDQELTVSQFGLKPTTMEEFIRSVVNK